MQFAQAQVKAKNVESFREQLEVTIAGSQVSIYSDLSLIKEMKKLQVSNN